MQHAMLESTVAIVQEHGMCLFVLCVHPFDNFLLLCISSTVETGWKPFERDSK